MDSNFGCNEGKDASRSCKRFEKQSILKFGKDGKKNIKKTGNLQSVRGQNPPSRKNMLKQARFQ